MPANLVAFQDAIVQHAPPMAAIGRAIAAARPQVLAGTPHVSIVGESMCGTTTLFLHLARHRHIVPALNRHTQYFKALPGTPLGARHGERNDYLANFANFALRRDPGLIADPGLDDDARAYLRSLRDLIDEVEPLAGIERGGIAPEALISADQSTCFSHPAAHRRLFAHNPKTRLILLLRDPVARGYAFFHRVHVIEQPKGLSFADGLGFADLKRRCARGAGPGLEELADSGIANQVLGYGLYIEHLERWLSLFPLSQFLILDSGELSRAPQAVLDRVCDFLAIPRQVCDGLGDVGQSRDKPPLDPEVRAVLADYFAPYNARLYDRLGRDFGW